ncbi:MAG: hypothetical protein KBA13_05415, partial [Chitinophagales bacterium]|nr:hypothetical protein [Chitinophagales bacterium]
TELFFEDLLVKKNEQNGLFCSYIWYYVLNPHLFVGIMIKIEISNSSFVLFFQWLFNIIYVFSIAI